MKKQAVIALALLIAQNPMLFAEGSPIAAQGTEAPAQTVSADQPPPAAQPVQAPVMQQTGYAPLSNSMMMDSPLEAADSPAPPAASPAPSTPPMTAPPTTPTMVNNDTTSIDMIYNAASMKGKELAGKMDAAAGKIEDKLKNMIPLLEADPAVDRKALQELKNQLQDPAFVQSLMGDLANMTRALKALDDAKASGNLDQVKAAAAQVDSYYTAMNNKYVVWSAITDMTIDAVKAKLRARAAKLIFKTVTPYVPLAPSPSSSPRP